MKLRGGPERAGPDFSDFFRNGPPGPGIIIWGPGGPWALYLGVPGPFIWGWGHANLFPSPVLLGLQGSK